jgi:hypothetical protein
VYRTVRIIDADLYIEDVVKTNENPASISWRMITSATPAIVEDLHCVKLERNGKVKYLTVESEHPVVFKEWSTTPEKNYESPNTFAFLIGFESSLSSNKRCKIKVKISSTPPLFLSLPPFEIQE